MRCAWILLTALLAMVVGLPPAIAERGAADPLSAGPGTDRGVMRVAEQKAPPLPDKRPPKKAAKHKPAKPARKKHAGPRKKPEQETKERTRAEKCEALMACRALYTKCDNGVYAAMKPGPKRDKARDNCVLEYQKCIRANFKTTEMLIIRWLWPGSKCPW